jgi:exodeoxyribonuclease-3
MSELIRIASWNVNSIRQRLPHLQDWLAAAAPDVACLQETKVQDHEFPRDAYEALGYHVHIYGQKSYNGVAIFSRTAPEEVSLGFPGEPLEAQRRVIAATVQGIRVVNVYIPNGESVGSEKFAYKMRFLEQLHDYLAAEIAAGRPLLLCGDFNIAPADADVYDPERLRETIMFHASEHAFLDRLRALGLTDTFRLINPEASGQYSWWDYRMNAFKRNIGYRIDHLWVTPDLAARCVESRIDRDERAREKPSDHAPVVAGFKLEAQG